MVPDLYGTPVASNTYAVLITELGGNMVPIPLNRGLETLLLTFVDQAAISADEEQLLRRVQHAWPNMTVSGVRTVLDFAIGCGYVEKLNERLALTKSGQERAKKFRQFAD